MKIPTMELKGKMLDWAVATIEGYTNLRVNPHKFDNGLVMTPPRKAYGPVYLSDIAYSTDQDQGGSILDQYDISVWLTLNGLHEKGKWSAALPSWFDETDPTMPLDPEAAYGDTRLEAGMRALVRDRMGHEVDVPDELIRTLPSPDEEGLVN
jgi:hypothetical protein